VNALNNLYQYSAHDPCPPPFAILLHCIGSAISQGLRQARDLLRVLATVPPDCDPLPDHAYSNTTDVMAGNTEEQSVTMTPEKKEVLLFLPFCRHVEHGI
jgi:hypothetical protein